jgi:glycosyltransferase involved in cell wall biosynthesis
LNVRGPETGLVPPRFSIIITFCNQRNFIGDALGSALALRNTGLEVIAVDDASTDGSQEILRKYRDAVQLVCLETNQGACAARNRGASLATGDFLVFLDGDDAFLPWALDVYGQIVRAKNPELILATMSWFEGTLPAVPPEDAPHEITMVDYSDYWRRDRSFGNSASALVVARQAFEDVHGWSTSVFPMDDQDLTLRLGASGRAIQILSPATILHREHAGNSINNISACINGVGYLLRQERLGHYPGGAGRKLERCALIGGVVFHWTRRAAKRGMYREAMKLMARGWPMVSAAIARRIGVLIGGRQPCEIIKIWKRCIP